MTTQYYVMQARSYSAFALAMVAQGNLKAAKGFRDDRDNCMKAARRYSVC